MNISLFDIAKRLEAAQSVLVVSHDRPDPDALGSALALGRLLKNQGKRVVVVNHDPVPELLHFLPGYEAILRPGPAESFDVFAVLDSSTRARVHSTVWEMASLAKEIINLDHHLSNSYFGDYNHVAPDSPATGVLVYRLAEEAGWPLDSAIAINLMAAISGDTGSFRYSSTTSETLRIAASLMDFGVNIGEINERLYESNPFRSVEILKVMLARLRMDVEGRCASVSLPYALGLSYGLQEGEVDSVVDVIRAIDSVQVAVLFEELADGMIRISSRGKRGMEVRPICEQFGGGGHAVAAGARVKGPLAEVESRFLAAVREALDQKGLR